MIVECKATHAEPAQIQFGLAHFSPRAGKQEFLDLWQWHVGEKSVPLHKRAHFIGNVLATHAMKWIGLSLDQQHVVSGTLEQQRRDQACQSATDDTYVAHCRILI